MNNESSSTSRNSRPAPRRPGNSALCAGAPQRLLWAALALALLWLTIAWALS